MQVSLPNEIYQIQGCDREQGGYQTSRNIKNRRIDDELHGEIVLVRVNSRQVADKKNSSIYDQKEVYIRGPIGKKGTRFQGFIRS